MTKGHKNNQQTNRYSLMNSYGELLNNELRSDEKLFYARDNLLPILNIKMLVKERSREELSDTDLIVLKLIELGIISVESITLFTGLANKLVEKHLAELVGRSFVISEKKNLTLTEIGKETLELGVPIRLVQRAFRYCAVAEELLPRDAYDLVYTEIANLRSESATKAIRFSHVLDEKQMVSLAGLDLSAIDSKRAVNITDEAMAFSEMVGYSSGYLQTRLFLVGVDKPERALVSFGNVFWEYDLDDILLSIQQLDKGKALQQLSVQLSRDGLGDAEVSFDEFGLPIIKILHANKNWLTKKLESSIQAILLCGTEQQLAKPVFLKGRDLNGHTARFILEDKELQREADLLRQLSDIGDSYFATPFNLREVKSVAEYVGNVFDSEDIKLLKVLATKYNITRFNKWLPAEIEEVTNG